MIINDTQSQLLSGLYKPEDDIRSLTFLLFKFQVNVTGENAGEVSEQVSVVTTNTEQITSDDITFVAEIISEIVQQNATSEEVFLHNSGPNRNFDNNSK